MADATVQTSPSADLDSENTRRFRQMIDALPAAVYTTDARGRITHFNPACVAFSGRTPEIGSDHWCVTWKLYHPDGRPMPHDECPMAIAIKEGRIIRGAEAIAERPDGTRIWFEPYPTPLLDTAGNLVGGINMLVDITERKRAEERLRRNAETFATLVEQSPLGIYTVDSNFRIAHVSVGALPAFQNVQPVIGRDFAEVMHAIWPEPFASQAIAIFRHTLETGEPYISPGLTETRRDLGSTESYEWQINRVTLDDGQRGVVCYYFDATRIRQAEEKLRTAKQEADDANRAKDKFMAVLSHELRTPLTPVLMTAAALERRDDLPPGLREDMTMIRRNVELQSRLIDDLLDLSRITSGKLRLSFNVHPVNDLVRHACDTCRPNLREKGIHLYCNFDAEAFGVLGDGGRLQQVFWNLLNNATKFTPAGGQIFVRSEHVAGTDAGLVRVTVRDTGIGIAPDALERIFDAFEQAGQDGPNDSAIAREFGGMGLGLAICRALVEQHHGSIRAHSDGGGKGSTFVVELPGVLHHAEDGANSRPPEPEKLPPMRLLIVEDHADTAEVLARMLEASGHEVKAATTAAEALKLAGEHTFDIIVSDLGLPDMTGYELMQCIKRCGSIKGIAMSGYGMEEDVRKSHQAGFSDHIVKPASVEQLEQSIRRITVIRAPG